MLSFSLLGLLPVCTKERGRRTKEEAVHTLNVFALVRRSMENNGKHCRRRVGNNTLTMAVGRAMHDKRRAGSEDLAQPCLQWEGLA